MENVPHLWKPRRWLAVVLSLFVGNSGLLYVGAIRWYLVYALLPILISVIAVFVILDDPITSFLPFFGMISWCAQIAGAIHSYRLASSYVPGSKRPWYSHWWGILVTYLIILLITLIPIFVVRAFFYEPYKMPSSSMSPSYNNGEYIIISKFGYGNYGTFGVDILHTQPTKQIIRGDVIVFAFPKDPKYDYMKRVIGLPHDRVVYKNKALYINGEQVSTSKLTQEEVARFAQKSSLLNYVRGDLNALVAKRESIGDASWTVIENANAPAMDIDITLPDDSYFVLGDKRDNSNDSRFWGFVPGRNIKGKVIKSFEAAWE